MTAARPTQARTAVPGEHVIWDEVVGIYRDVQRLPVLLQPGVVYYTGDLYFGETGYGHGPNKPPPVICQMVDETGMIHRFDLKPEPQPAPTTVLAPIPDLPLEEINPNPVQGHNQSEQPQTKECKMSMLPFEREELNREHAKLWEAIGRAESHMEAIVRIRGKDMEMMTKALESLDKRMTELCSKVNNIHNSLSSVITEMGGRITELSNKCKMLAVDGDKRRADIHALSVRLNKIEADYFPQAPRTKEALVELVNGIEGLNRNMRAIYNRVGALEEQAKTESLPKDLGTTSPTKSETENAQVRPHLPTHVHTAQYAFVSGKSGEAKIVMHTRRLSDGQIRQLAGCAPGGAVEVDRLDRCPACEAWTITADPGGKELWEALDCPAVQAELTWEMEQRDRPDPDTKPEPDPNPLLLDLLASCKEMLPIVEKLVRGMGEYAIIRRAQEAITHAEKHMNKEKK